MKRIFFLIIIIIIFISCVKHTSYLSKEPILKIALAHKISKAKIYSSGDYYMISGNKKMKLSSKDTVYIYKSAYNPIVYINKTKRIKKIYYPVNFVSKSDFIYYNRRPYRGIIFIIRDADNYLLIINKINMENYLKGVVPAEIGRMPINKIEASKAQAIAARTYAYSHIGRFYDMGYDLECTVADQVYLGVSVEDSITNLAIKQTKGIVAMYNNKPIEAKYHSTCGGYTSNNEDAWNGAPIPYLRKIKDGEGCLFFNRVTYCSQSKHYRWKHIFKKSEFYDMLSDNMSKKLNKKVKIVKFKIIKKDKSGRVSLIRLYDNKKNTYDIRGLNIRKLFSNVDAPGGFLRSRFFNIKVGFNNVVIEGRGFGHGVGMCQYGAMEMANRGKSYKQILQHYYRGIKLKKLY